MVNTPRSLGEGAQLLAQTAEDGATVISDAITAVRDEVWSGVSAVARSVSRSFSTGPSHARYDRMEEEDERKKKMREYQKLQWIESMERNLGMLKQIIDHRRNELHIVDMGNDLEKKRALETEVRDLKVRQARLSCALWVQPEDLPSSQTLLEMKNPKKLQAELEAKLVQLGLIEAKSKPPLPSSPVDMAQAAPKIAPKLLLRPSSDRGRGSPETRSPSDSPAPQVQGARPQTPRRRGEKGEEIKGEGKGATAGKGPAKGPPGGPKGVPAWAKGAAKGKGPGKGPDEAGKGGKKGGPPAKGGRIRKVTPLGRRFHWKELNAEKVKGTVFDKGESPMDTIDVQFDGLKNYFADDDELSKQGVPVKRQSQETITVFDNTRMQNIAIVLRGVFGQMPSVQDMEFLAAGIDAVDPARAGPIAPCLRDADKVALLPTAMPTDDEANQLREHPPERLRQVERLILPLAQLTRCGPRIRALRLAVHAEVQHDALQGRIASVQNACDALRESVALRRFLRTVAKLGSWINSADPEMEKGFAVSSALGKLRLFRAVREDKAVSLLHVAIMAAAGSEVPVVQRLCGSLALELEVLELVAREDLTDLEQAVKSFKADEVWLLRECEGDYSLQVRARLRAVHREQLERLRQLEEAYGGLRPKLSETLAYFAEAETPSVDVAAEQLFKTLHSFKKDVASASKEVLAQPSRFLKAYAAGAAAEAAAQEKAARQARARSVSAARPRRQLGPSLADRVAMQKLANQGEASSHAAIQGDMPAGQSGAEFRRASRPGEGMEQQA